MADAYDDDDAGAPDDVLEEALECFRLCEERERDNRAEALDDLRFARLGEQWPSEIRKKREEDGRPCLTINKLPASIRQVVNDARQNKPAIKCHPADSYADVHTAEILNGLIRSIEVNSKADVAYDTAIEGAVTNGFGFIRVNAYYPHDDSFDVELCIDAVPNPLTVYPDPYSTAADSADWNDCFVTEMVPKAQFTKRWKGAKQVDWDGEPSHWGGPLWWDGDSVQVAEWWRRREVPGQLLMLSNGEAMDEEVYVAQKAFLDTLGLVVVSQRPTRSYKVTQTILSGAEVLSEMDWKGKYIPIVPVWGDVVNVEGKRYLRSMVRDAKDPQRMFNYWRTTSTELVALAPKAPFIGPKGAFKTDNAKWSSANTENWSYMEYDGAAAPERQPFAGVPAGALQEAMNASDDMKSVMGLFDASMGAPSPEPSGSALLMRRKEGDTSSFHFADNQSRAVEQVGRILLDLIPKVYTGDRMIRVLGVEGEQQAPVQLGSRSPPPGAPPGAPPAPIAQPRPGAVPTAQGWSPQDLVHVFDLGLGKYDLTVETGPSFTTRREEAANQMMLLMQANPAVAPVIGDLFAKNLDWPNADEIARRLQLMLPSVLQGQNPEVQQLTQQLQQVQAASAKQIAQLQDSLRQAGDAVTDMQVKLDQAKSDADVKRQQVQIDAYNAETARGKMLAPKGYVLDPNQAAAAVLKALTDLTTGPDISTGEGSAPAPAPPVPLPMAPMAPMAHPGMAPPVGPGGLPN